MGSQINLKAMEVRLHKLKNNGKNFDSPGVVKKLERQIRNLKEKGEDEQSSFLYKEILWDLKVME